jgi:hypothetical protein
MNPYFSNDIILLAILFIGLLLMTRPEKNDPKTYP